MRVSSGPLRGTACPRSCAGFREIERFCVTYSDMALFVAEVNVNSQRGTVDVSIRRVKVDEILACAVAAVDTTRECAVPIGVRLLQQCPMPAFRRHQRFWIGRPVDRCCRCIPRRKTGPAWSQLSLFPSSTTVYAARRGNEWIEPSILKNRFTPLSLVAEFLPTNPAGATSYGWPMRDKSRTVLVW